jgi:DNA-directed RNA polymerase subunit RPC12/RpoP
MMPSHDRSYSAEQDHWSKCGRATPVPNSDTLGRPHRSVPAFGGMKTIASLEVGQTDEIMDRLKKAEIPAEIRTIAQESGLEMSEIIVEDSHFARGCDVVEAWYAEMLAEQKKISGVRCRRCGSRNYDRTWHETLGYSYKCKDCGEGFAT